jgi:ABC-type transporter MlaC component
MKRFFLICILAVLSLNALSQNIADIITQTNLDSLIKTVRVLSGEDSAWVNGTKILIKSRSNSLTATGNNQAADYIKARLLRYNLKVEDQAFNITGRNIIATQTGITSSGSIYIICAHYDAVAYYCADDDASGVSAVIEAARILSNQKFDNTILYALWDNEEDGSVGSTYYAKLAYSKGYKIAGVLNLDMLGYDSNSDKKFEIHTNSLTASLAIKDELVRTVSNYSLSLIPQVKNPGASNSDHGSFWNYDYGAVDMSELFFGGDGNPFYHTSSDRVSLFNLPYFRDLSKLAIGTLATLAGLTSGSAYTIASSAGSGGSISPSGSISVISGSNQTFTITPGTGYKIADVLVDGISVGVVTSYMFQNVTASHTISALFSATTSTFTITSSAGTGGNISPSGSISMNSGSDQTFNIIPGTGYKIANVLVDGVSVGTVTSYEFKNVMANHTISALFSATTSTFTITSSAGTGGNISPYGSISVTSGSDQTFYIIPGTGYKIANVLVDGVSVGTVTSYEFKNVMANHTISAAFSAITSIALNKPASSQSVYLSHFASLANDANGTNSSYWQAMTYPKWWKVDLGGIYDITGIVIRNYVDGRRYYHYTIEGSSDDKTYSPIASKTSSSVATNSGDSYTVSTSARYLRVNITYNSSGTGVHISDFRVYGTLHQTFNITASAGTGGTITPSGTVSMSSGSNQVFTVTAGVGYQISDVLVDGISVGAVPSYEFQNVTTNHSISAVFSVMINIALNKQATSQSDYSSLNVASKGNDEDGSNNSMWAGAPYPQWWKVDLGDVYQITGIVIRNYVDGIRYYHYNIDASIDDMTYIQIESKTDDRAATDSGDGYPVSTTARYLRLNMTYNSDNAGVHLCDFRVYGTPLPNIALNKPAMSQSDYSSSYVASKGNDEDGSNNSMWAGAPYPVWWKVDLGDIYDITRIVVRNYVDGIRYYHYNIDASIDDKTYIQIESKTDDRAATDSGDSYPVSATARYLRLNMTYNSDNAGVHLCDFRAYGTPLPNIALNKPATSQSNYSSSYVASKGNDEDGSNNSMWAGAPYPEWWKVDLGDIYDITRIVIRNFVDSVRYYHYNIEGSKDDQTYTRIAAKTDNSVATDLGDIYSVTSTARYLRINMTFNSSNIGVHLSDFKAYGTPTAGGKGSDFLVSPSFKQDKITETVQENFRVNVYPNPFKDHFTIKIDSPNEEMFGISIISLTGGKVHIRTKIPANTENTFNLELSKGMYMLVVNNTERRKVYRIVRY